jgi:hypothetical protein
MDRTGHRCAKCNKPGIEPSHSYLESKKVDLVDFDNRMVVIRGWG